MDLRSKVEGADKTADKGWIINFIEKIIQLCTHKEQSGGPRS